MKTPGQVVYEDDCRAHPFYEDGTPRRTWAQLADSVRSNWERTNPRPEWCAVSVSIQEQIEFIEGDLEIYTHLIETDPTDQIAAGAARAYKAILATLRRVQAEAQPEPGKADPWDAARGAAPDATGNLSSEAFVRKIRDEWATRDVADVLGNEGF